MISTTERLFQLVSREVAQLLDAAFDHVDDPPVPLARRAVPRDAVLGVPPPAVDSHGMATPSPTASRSTSPSCESSFSGRACAS